MDLAPHVDLSSPLSPRDVETILHEDNFSHHPDLKNSAVSTSSIGPAPVVRIRRAGAHLLRNLLEGYASIRVVAVNADGTTGDPRQKKFAFMDPIRSLPPEEAEGGEA